MLLLPILVPLCGGLALFRVTSESRRDRLSMALALASCALAVLVCLLPEQTLTLLTIRGDLVLALRNDALARFFLVLVTFVWAAATAFSLPYIYHAGRGAQYHGFSLVSLAVVLGVVLAANFVTLYMFFELMTLITMPLVLHNATPQARRGGFLYLGFSVFGAGMALAGWFFLSPYLADQAFTPGGSLTAERPELLAVYVLMVAGFGAKAGMMPMQAWLPAAHPEAPAPASALLSGIITKGGVAAIIRVSWYMFRPGFLRGTWAQSLLLTLALATVFAGSMLAYREKLLKRRLAYSTVSQVSYVLFGILLLTEGGLWAALTQVVFHALAKNALFLSAGAIIYATGQTRVDQLRGIGRRMPVTLGCFTVGALSLIGIPPLAGFVSKWRLVSAGLETGGAFGIAGMIVLILSALLTAGYLLPIVTEGYFPSRDWAGERKEVGRWMLVPMGLLAAALAVLGLFPGLLPI